MPLREALDPAQPASILSPGKTAKPRSHQLLCTGLTPCSQTHTLPGSGKDWLFLHPFLGFQAPVIEVKSHFVMLTQSFSWFSDDAYSFS